MDNQKFTHTKLQQFYNFAIKQDISILLVRQSAYSLFVDAMDDDGSIELSDALTDKLTTFLRSDETQYGGPNTTGLYAFQKHLTEIRKALRRSGYAQHRGTMSPSVPGSPESSQPDE